MKVGNVLKLIERTMKDDGVMTDEIMEGLVKLHSALRFNRTFSLLEYPIPVEEVTE